MSCRQACSKGPSFSGVLVQRQLIHSGRKLNCFVTVLKKKKNPKQTEHALCCIYQVGITSWKTGFHEGRDGLEINPLSVSSSAQCSSRENMSGHLSLPLKSPRLSVKKDMDVAERCLCFYMTNGTLQHVCDSVAINKWKCGLPDLFSLHSALFMC